MNINYRETQYNFLENQAVSSRDPRSPRVLSAQLTLSIENLVIFTIVSIMVMLFCFSAGVERGKRLALSGEKATDGVMSQAVQTVPTRGVAPEDEDVIEAGEAKKNIFTSLLASLGTKGKLAAQTEQTPPIKASADLKYGGGTPAYGQEKTAKVQPVTPMVTKQTATGSSYTVQVATYKSEKSAKREAESLKQKGYRDIYVLPKGAFVIVCVGSFPNKSDASTFTRQLKNRYQDPVVRRL